MRAQPTFVIGLLVACPFVVVPPLIRAQEKVVGPPDQQQAIKAIQELEGTVSRDEKVPGHPVSEITFYHPIKDENVQLVRAFPHLQSLRFSDAGITDASLARLEGLVELESLDIWSAKITDAGLAHLKAMTRLEWLMLSNVGITDAGLAHLKELTGLRSLTLSKVAITDAGLEHLKGLSNLRTLDLTETAVTEAGAAKLKEALPYTLIDIGQTPKEIGKAEDWGASLLRTGGLIALGIGAALFLLLRPWRLTCQGRSWVWKLPMILGLILAVDGAVLGRAPSTFPLQDGDPARFWLHACRIDVGLKSAKLWGGFYQPRDGWFIYYGAGMHGQFLYRVKEVDALALFPRVVQRLENAPPGALYPDVEKAAQESLRADPKRADASFLLAKLREVRLARVQQEDLRLFQYLRGDEDDFSERWGRIQRYPWNVGFEMLFFAALILFGAWPWLRGSGRWRWAIHLGLLPFLFLLPLWLGYAQMSFTSMGPTGGVLYPYLVVQLRGLPWTSLDRLIVGNLPQVLEPLTQTPGPMMALSGGGGVGPVGAGMIGLVAGLVPFGIAAALRRIRQKGRRSAITSPCPGAESQLRPD